MQDQKDAQIHAMEQKLNQLDSLLHDALQEKMDLKNQFIQTQQNQNVFMQNMAKIVSEVRTHLMNNSKDKKAAQELCAMFDPYFGQHPTQEPKNAEVDKDAVAKA